MRRTSRRTSPRSTCSGSRPWSSPSWRRTRPPSRTGPSTRAGQRGTGPPSRRRRRRLAERTSRTPRLTVAAPQHPRGE
eukprot:909452-Pyramimonas_sp.AAC.1